MKLFFRKYGESGPPLIIVHGLYGSSDNWISIARELSEQFEVYILDQRNHGDSPHSDVHDYPSMKADLKEFMESRGIESATLLGHSMGGKTVMLFAMEHPEMVDSMVVVDIAPISYRNLAVNSHIAANHSKMIDAMLSIDLAKYRTRQDVSNALSVQIGSDRIRMFLLKNLSRNKKKEFYWKINLPVLKDYLDQIMDQLPTEKYIEKGGITGFPAYFIKGEKSDYIRPEHHDIIRRLFPTAEVISIPNAGHWVHAEQSDLLVKNLKYLLS